MLIWFFDNKIIFNKYFQILGINRCIEMVFPKIAKTLFHGYRVYIWISFCNLNGFYWLFFCHPNIFNGIAYEILLDPLTGYEPFRPEFVCKNNIFILF